MKKLLQSLFILIFIAGSAMAQTRTITGTVTDKEDGKPLPGVTVKIKGVAGGTQTGSDGKFALSVPSSATQLEFTYLGYVLQSRPVADVVNVSLSSDATSLAETIIVGYQVQKKETVTGAQTVITGEKLESIPNGNVATTLQGKAPGLQVLGNSGKPGDPPFLRVRGTSSLTAGNSPLILIDGVDAPNLNSVNSADIESVTLLKDPSSTSIYGSRAANGVLLITTKKGKAGEPQFDYSFQYGKKSRVKDNFDLMSTEEKLQYEYDLGYENNEVGNYFARNNFPSSATLFDITPAERATLYDALLAQSHDWKKDLFRDGTVKEHQLGLSGATDKMHYYFNLNRYEEDGIAIGSAFKRTGGRINADYQAKSWLKVGTNLTASYTQESTVRESYNVLSPFGSYYFLNAYEPVRNPDGSYNNTAQGLNPISAVLDAPAFTNRVNSTGGAFAEITPIKDLLIRSNVGLTYSKTGAGVFYKPGSQVDAAIFGTAAPGYKEDSGNETFFYIWTNTAQYTKKINEDHELTGLIGFEYLKNNTSSYNFSSKGYPSTEVQYSTQNNGARPNATTSALTNYNQVSYFGKLSYNYQQKYFLDGSVRRDGSSRFGVGQRYGTFYSAGAGWNVLKESFSEGSIDGIFNTLRLRASYGKTGNNQIGDYDAQGIYAFGKYNGQSVIGESRLGNKNLSWESSYAYNIGLDLGVFDNRLRGSIEYYNRKTTDLLYRVPKSSTVGFGVRLENTGEMTNKGWEFDLSGDVIRNNDLTVTLFANFTQNENKLTKLYGDVQFLASSYTALQVGKPINNFYLTRWAGIDPATGATQYLDKDGATFTDVSRAGGNAVVLDGKSPNPKYFGSFGTTVTYKGISLNGQFYYNAGNYIYNIPYRDLTNNGNDPSTPQMRDALNYWKNPGDNVSFSKPVLGQTQVDNDHYLQKGDYLRLRELTLGYSLPKSLISKAKVQNVRLFLIGTNLFTWTKEYKGDPEVGRGNNERPDDAPGVLALYPYTPSRAYTFGINITL